MLYKISLLILIAGISVSGQIDSTLDVLPDEFIEDENHTATLLDEYLNSPLDLNQISTVSDLKIFPFLSAKQIQILYDNKPYINKSAVKHLLGSETYHLFRPFFFTGKYTAPFRWHFTTRIRFPVEKSLGIRKNIYPGPEYDLYSKLQFSIKQSVSAGMLIQKDPGEIDHWDHISGFLSWNGWENRLKLTLGNFILHAGQGLVLSSPFSQQKSASAGSALRTRDFYSRSYLSSNETSGLMGICATLDLPDNLSATLFYSRINRDATVAVPGKITGFALSGLHRTVSEKLTRDLLSEETLGGVIQAPVSKYFLIGSAFTHTTYDPDINLKHKLSSGFDVRNNFFGFSGRNLNSYSVFYRFTSKEWNISAEFATNRIKKISAHFVCLFSLDQWKFGARFWHLSTGFQSPHGRIFGDQSAYPSGEQGFYLGISGKVTNKISIDVYWNSCKKLWRSYFEPFPPSSSSIFTQCSYKWKATTLISIRFQQQKNSLYITDSHKFTTGIKKRYRIQFDHKLRTGLELRTRFSITYLPSNESNISLKGSSFFQEIRANLYRTAQLIFRFSSFRSDDYDSRTYELEHALAGSSSLAALYNSGIRWYLILKVDLASFIQLSLKYRHLKYDGADSIGNGWDMIDSDKKQEFGLQIRISN